MRITIPGNRQAAAANRSRSADAFVVNAFAAIAIVPVVVFPVTGGSRLE